MVLKSIIGSEDQLDRGVSPDHVVPVVTRWLSVTTVSPDELAMGKLAETRGAGSTSSEHSLTLHASIESEDRAGDVIRAEGWELDNYRLNPVVLWAHRHDLLPVGKSVDVWVDSGALMATVEFAPTEFAQQVRRLFEGGFLRGVSVGFRALKASPRSGNGASGDGRTGIVFERQELLEISAAPVPMHPLALAGAISTSRDATAAGSAELAVGESEQRELIPLFRELTEAWESIASVC